MPALIKLILRHLLCLIFILVALRPAYARENPENALIPKERGQQQVDSLNESAFQVKRHNINQALTLLNQALALATKNHYQKGEAITYLYEAGIYQQYGYSKKALLLYYKSLEISQALQDTFNIARANQQIGNALMESGKLKDAKALFRQSLLYYSQLKRRDDIINVKNSLGLIHLEQKDWAAAAEYFTQAFEESKSKKYIYGFKKSNYHLGLLYFQTGDLAKAKAYFNTALASDVRTNDKYGLALTKNKLSVIARQEGKQPEAIRWATAAWQDAQVISATQLVIESLENLAAIYRDLGNYKKTAEWQQVLIGQQKQLSEQERSFTLNFLNILKEKEEEQLAIEKQVILAEEKARLTYFILFIGGLALIVLAFLAYMWYKNFIRVKAFSKELQAQNEVIEKSAFSLEQLNLAISKQNIRLSESNLMKNKLLFILSHDLRSPLTNTKGLLHLINSGLLRVEKAKPLLVALENQYLRSLTLLDNLLFWIKSQMDGKPIVLKSTELKVLLAGLIEEQQVPIQEKGIMVLNEADPAITVEGDKEMLKVIFRNLLSNSIKFTRTNGKIKINASVGRQVAVQIKDEGIGMSPEDLNNIRDRKTFSTKGTANETGSGFGLIICQDLISRHNGELLIESELDQGSLFTVKLPHPGKREQEPVTSEQYQVAGRW